MRQKTCFVALGRDLRGLAASAAARPTSSVPPKANAAVTKTEQKPLKPVVYRCEYHSMLVLRGIIPLRNATLPFLLSFQYRKPMYPLSSVGTPPQLTMM